MTSHPGHMPYTFFACLLMLFGLFGCSGKNYHVSVDAERKTERIADGTRCVVLPGLDGADQSSAEFKAYAAQVARALTELGFCVVEDPLQAELAVFISYGSAHENGREQRSLQIEATLVEVRDTMPRLGESVWQITTRSSDAANMENAFPLLLAAAKPYLGKNTLHSQEVDIPILSVDKSPAMAFNK